MKGLSATLILVGLGLWYFFIRPASKKRTASVTLDDEGATFVYVDPSGRRIEW